MKHLLITTVAAVLLVGTAFADQIHDVAWKGDLAGVQRELKKGADVNAKDYLGRIPLHHAARWGHKKVAELLISEAADVDAMDDDGWTPLHYAAVFGRKEIAELLIDNGADVNAKRSDGSTSLDWAIGRKHSEVADLLRKHGGKTGEEIALMPRLVQHGRFAFSFDAKEGKVYEVQDSFDLLNWEAVKTYTGTGSSVRFDEERDHDPPKWFYRVRVVE